MNLSLLAALTLMLQPQDLDRKITFDTVAKNTKQVLAKLSEKAGVRLLSAPVLDSQVLVIRVQGVPLKDLMAKIADVSLAKWEKEGESYRLQPDVAKEQQAERDALARRAAILADALAKTLKDLDRKPLTAESSATLVERMTKFKVERFDDRWYADYKAFEARMPGGLLYARLVSQLDPRELAAATGQRIVYSNEPTKMQRPFPRGAAPFIKQFLDEQRLWSEAAKKAIDATINEGADLLDLLKQNKRLDDGLGKVLLAVRNQGDQDDLNLKLTVYDKQGFVVCQVEKDMGRNTLDPTFRPRPSSSSEPALEFSARSTEVIEWQKGQAADKNANKPLTPALREYLLDPVENDPLSLLASDQLMGLSKARGQNLVALLPDSAMLELGHVYSTAKVTPTVVEQTLSRSRDLHLVVALDGWLQIEPVAPLEARLKRTDRLALSKLLRSAVAKHAIDLDEIAAFALAYKGDDGFGIMAWSLVEMLSPESMEGLYHEPDLARLHGSLSVPQRQSLEAGGNLPFAGANAVQKAILHRMLFGTGEIYFNIKPPAEGADAKFSNQLTALIQEPTEMLPQGLPAGGHLLLKSTPQEIALAFTANSPVGKAVNAEDLAVNSLAKQSKTERQPVEWTEYQLGLRTTRQFSLEFTPQVSLQFALWDNYFDRSKPKVKYGDLPSTLREAVDRAISTLRGGG